MGVLEIIGFGLNVGGFDGLVVPGQCGCVAGDLSPGNCLSDKCEPGYKHTHSITGEWIISKKLDFITDADIEKCIAECC
jgi:hypothetical protein